MGWLFLICVPTALYGFLILWFYYGWSKLKPFEHTQSNPEQFVSIVIAARNEADNLPFILADLAKQTYPTNLFEIIVVDDHSTDNSMNVIFDAKTHLKNLQYISLQNNLQGKKHAIKEGINAAKSEIIFTTDADCRVGAKWVETLVSFFLRNRIDLLIGPIAYQNEKNIFENMQSLEILSMVASGAGAAAVGFPILCNGANLAFTRTLYNASCNEVMIEIPSGDDIFLLQAAKTLKDRKIHFIKSFDALVYTQPTKTICEFLSQRKRWTSKSKHYKDWTIKLSAALVFLICLIICCLFILTFIWPKFLFLYFVILIMKAAIDFPLLFSFTGYFKKRYLMKYFAITQLVYPFYIVFMAIYGNISNFEWKSRLYQ